MYLPDDTVSSLSEFLVDNVTFVDNEVLVEDFENLSAGHRIIHA